MFIYSVVGGGGIFHFILPIFKLEYVVNYSIWLFIKRRVCQLLIHRDLNPRVGVLSTRFTIVAYYYLFICMEIKGKGVREHPHPQYVKSYQTSSNTLRKGVKLKHHNFFHIYSIHAHSKWLLHKLTCTLITSQRREWTQRMGLLHVFSFRYNCINNM